MTADMEQLGFAGSDWPELTDSQQTVEYLVGRARAQLDREWPARVKNHQQVYSDMPWIKPDRQQSEEDVDIRVRAAIERWVASVPAEFQAASYMKLGPDQHVDRLQRWLDSPKVQTLWIAGMVGNGKTFSAYAVAGDQVVRSYGFEAESGWPVVMNTVDMLEQLKPSHDDHEKVWNRVRNCHLLVLDDLGVARPTDWAIEQLYALSDFRSRTRKRTLITLNKSMADLKAHWGPAIVDRFVLNSGVLNFQGTSRRQVITDW